MRKLITVFLLLTFSGSRAAQTPYHWECGTFTIDATDTLIYCPPISTNYIYFTITNTGTADINVRQIINSTNLPSGWSFNMCNPNACWGPGVLIDTFLVPASGFVTARFDFHTDTTIGTGITSVRFDDSAAPSVYGATFNLHAVSQATGIASEQDGYNSITLFPNPVSNELRIQNAEFRVEGIEIYNVSEQRVFPSPLVPLSLRRGDERGEVINISSLPSGIYFVKIKTEEGILTAKFVKQ